ncbi:MAG TPA: adenylate/guanylate cyclase domain-containing protein [Kofleriaceae bacterium]|nr:adenylate/guanylate cyclase domain-containing protein [Kofleriaceae bacterium]
MLAGAVATLVTTGIYAGHRASWWTVPGLDRIELATLDARFRARGARDPADGSIVILGVDDKTREKNPEVFQTRRGWAALIDALSSYNPKAIGLDAFFGSPEVALDPEVVTEVRAAREQLAGELEKSPGALRALRALTQVVEQTRGDDILADSVQKSGRIFLGLLFFLPEKGEQPAPDGAAEPPGVGLARYGEAVAVAQPASRRPPRASYVGSSLAPIAAGARGAGALNVVNDPDGEVRRVHAVQEYGGRFYMPLGMAMALEWLGVDASYVVGDTEVRFGGQSAPVSPRGEAQLNHLGPNGTFPRVSAADVLAGTAPRDALEGKLVFVGFTDTARDKVATPFDTRMDGVEIHATLAHNLLHGELLRRTRPVTAVLTVLLLGALLTALQLRRLRQRRPWLVGLGSLLVLLVYGLSAQWLFADGLIVELAAPVLSGVIVTLAALSAALATEGREKRALRDAFSSYVNDTLVQRIVDDPSRAALALGGVRRELTVLFSDIRGFSRFSEKLPPEALSDFLNEYLTPMTELVLAQDGMLDKYIGDAIMAVYGAPIDQTDHARRACRTALAMMAALVPLNQRWKERGMPVIAIGIGVNTGPMSVGNMGSAARFDYTVMGDAVNLGARLEALTKEYRCGVLLGEGTAEAVRGEFALREIDLVRVMGRERPVRVHELVGEREQTRFSADDLDRFGAALAAYRAGTWDQAETGFARFLEVHADDGPAAVLLERTRVLRRTPPEAWDGVYAQATK